MLSTFNLYPLFWVTVKCPFTVGSTHTLKLSFQMWVDCVSSPCRFYWSNIIWRSSCHLHVNRREQFFVCFISIFLIVFFLMWDSQCPLQKGRHHTRSLPHASPVTSCTREPSPEHSDPWFVSPQVFWGHCINALVHSLILFWLPMKALEHGRQCFHDFRHQQGMSPAMGPACRPFSPAVHHTRLKTGNTDQPPSRSWFQAYRVQVLSVLEFSLKWLCKY